MYRNKDVVVLAQGEAMSKQRYYLAFFMTLVNTLMIIWMKYGDQCGRALEMVGLKDKYA